MIAFVGTIEAETTKILAAVTGIWGIIQVSIVPSVLGGGGGGGGFSQNLLSVTNDSFCYQLLKSLLLISYQQICY